MGWYERWAQWSEQYRFLVDLAATALIAFFAVILAADLYRPYDADRLVTMLVSVAVIAPLPWARIRPVASCVAVFAACLLHMTVLGMPMVLPADFAVIASLYCITVYGPRWAYLAAGVSAAVGSIAVGVAIWAASGGGIADGVPMMMLVGALLACAFAFGLVRRSRRTMLVAMRDRAVRLEIERDQQAQIATAAERARIAREMHDIVAHSLSVVIAQADGGRYAAAADPAAAERSLGTIAETGRAALADMRRLLGVLREGAGGGATPLGLVAPDDVPAGRTRPGPGASTGRTTRRGATGLGPGVGAAGPVPSAGAPGLGRPSTSAPAPLQPQPDVTDVGGLVEQARDDGLRVSWARVGVERRLPPGVGLTLFRVCQEALTNVRKHAGPSPAVTVMLRWGEGEVELRVEDDGRGLAAAGTGTGSGSEDPVPAAGYGLLGMRERAEMFGGTLAAGPRRGGGFSVRFTVPIPRASYGGPEQPVYTEHPTAAAMRAQQAQPAPHAAGPSTTLKEKDA
jgi:signal transduction histidine kinase